MAESTIITGQFVRINQTPASVGERILAWVVDYIILFLYIISTIYMIFYLEGKGQFGNHSGFTLYLFIALVYLPAICYSLLWEMFNNGQSPGKRLMGIRVVKLDGSTPSLSGYLLRWLLYGIDVIFTSGLGVIFVIVTKNNQRLGDLAAGTVVVKEKNYKKIQVSLDEFNYLTANYRPAYPQAADLSLEQINVITRTLETQHKERYRRIYQLAVKIRKMLGINQPDVSDEVLLNTLVRDYQYYALQEI